ncbi:MAG TPA: FAD-dependent monooxygenase, partial [Vicinamibacterales bacterium]|nr:FAD-dependent monooxygenase [Vicinamibacterales bacterium]
NVRLEEGCRVLSLMLAHDRGSIAGLQCKRDGRSETLRADLIVDASGGGDLTLGALPAAPPETTIGVDIGYSSAVFAIPSDAPTDWKGVMVFPDAPKSGRAGLMIPVEGHRWMLALAGRAGDQMPGDETGLRSYAATLRTPTIARSIEKATMVSDVERYRFVESRLRHFERLDSFQAGLLPLGDAICRFNPVFGQGMSVAALQANALASLLGDCASGKLSICDLWRPFFKRVAAIVEAPWEFAAVPDFIFPETRGERPPNLELSLRFGAALNQAAARHPDIHKLAAEVQHLLVPRSALTEPHVLDRVMAEM